jgi:hypothetical protein
LENNVTFDLDIWRAASLLIKQHGDDAPWVAVLRADELLAKGDPLGYETFKRIAKAIDELRRGEPTKGDAIN